MRAWPNQVDAHDQRHDHAEENAEERQPEVSQADGFVVVAEGQTAEDQAAEPWVGSFRGVAAVVVIRHRSFARTVGHTGGDCATKRRSQYIPFRVQIQERVNSRQLKVESEPTEPWMTAASLEF